MNYLAGILLGLAACLTALHTTAYAASASQGCAADALPWKNEAEGSTLSFVVLSHVYPILFDGEPADIEQLLAEIAACSPEALILPGDIVPGTFNVLEWVENRVFQSDRELRDELNRQWDYIFALFGRLNVPIWIAPGNHDIHSYQPQYQATVRQVFLENVGSPYHVKRMKEYRFIFLNSLDGTTESGHGVSSEQAQWLVEEMASDAQVTFAFVHHPLWWADYTIPLGNQGTDYDSWMEKIHPILNGQVAYVFAGDGGNDQNFLFYERLGQVYYYVNGSGRRGVSFLHVLVNGSDIQVLPHFLDISTRSLAQPSSPSSVGVLLDLFQRRTFWAGNAFAVAVIGLMLLAARASRRWRTHHP